MYICKVKVLNTLHLSFWMIGAGTFEFVNIRSLEVDRAIVVDGDIVVGVDLEVRLVETDSVGIGSKLNNFDYFLFL